MGRSILEIAREACQRHNTAPAPSSLFGEGAPHVGKILTIAAADTLRDVLRRSSWVGNSNVMARWVFALVPGRYAYELPPDFLRVIPDTEHLRGMKLTTLGAPDLGAWSRWILGGSGEQSDKGWHITNNVLTVQPTPTELELVAIDYISKFPVVSIIRPGDYDFSRQPPMTSAGIVPREGFIDVPAGINLAQDGPLAGKWDTTQDPGGWDQSKWEAELHEFLVRIHPLAKTGALPMVRREAFTADSDQSAFDDDHVLSLGLTYRLRRSLGLDYAEDQAEYDHEVDVRMATEGGGQQGFRLGRQRTSDVVPLGGGRWLVS